jgi:hypothetical protein
MTHYVLKVMDEMHTNDVMNRNEHHITMSNYGADNNVWLNNVQLNSMIPQPVTINSVSSLDKIKPTDLPPLHTYSDVTQ